MQIAGLQPGEAFKIAPNQEENIITQVYHLIDKSGNVATCQFQIKLTKSHVSKEVEDFIGQLKTDTPHVRCSVLFL